jgi:hypothetical protein
MDRIDLEIGAPGCFGLVHPGPWLGPKEGRPDLARGGGCGPQASSHDSGG